VNFQGETIHSASNAWKNLYKNSCVNCDFPIFLNENSDTNLLSLQYPYDWLVSGLSKQRWVKWKIKQLNSFASGMLDPSASYSDSSNSVGSAFAEFLSKNVKLRNINVFDVGCGPLKTSIYLQKAQNCPLYGLDPFDSKFEGNIISGVSEFIPLTNDSMDLVIASSVIDHFFDWKISLIEIHRILRVNGKFAIYNHLSNNKVEYRGTKISGKWFRLFENGYIVEIENKSGDPFHTEESLKTNWDVELFQFLDSIGFKHVVSESDQGFSIWEKIK